jgi:hypothetical protein
MTRIQMALATLLAVGSISPAHASEGGGGAYPNGAESFSVAQLPPPGTYGQDPLKGLQVQ